MKYKKLLITLTAAAITSAVVLSSCGTSSSTTTTQATSSSLEYANQTVEGVVEQVSDNTISLNLSKTITDANSAGQSGETPPEMPAGENSSGSAQPSGNGGAPSGDPGSAPSDSGSAPSGDSGSAPSDGETPPAKPDGDSSSSDNGSAPSGDPGSAPSDSGSAPSGDSGSAPSDGETPPAKPDGDSSSSDNSGSASDNSNENAANGSSNDSGESKSDDSSNESTDSTDSSKETTTAEENIIEVEVSDSTTYTNSDGDTITLDDIEVGDVISVTFDDEQLPTSIVREDDKTAGGNMQGGQGGQGAPGQTSNADISYTAVNEYTEDTEVSNDSISSTGTDEEAVLTNNGATVKLSNMTIDRTSSDSTGGDTSSWYGVGAAILSLDGTTYVDGSTITTDANGGAGVFAYGDGTAYVTDTTITTQKGTSGGLHVAGGGKLYASNCTVTTNGESSAALRSDKGGGTMIVDGGTYTSKGTGSPAIYSTADISVNDAELTAENSEAICIEGKNSIKLYGCDLTGNMPESDQNDVSWNVILYQSMSGDSEEGTSEFVMSDGTLTAENGGMFYTTNTSSTFYLNDVDITYSDDNPFFLQATGNSNARGWGSSGSNGAQCTFTADDQDMEGDIIYDSISTLDFYMENGSTLTGAVLDDETWAGNGGTADANLTISKDSTWVVTKNSTLTSLSNEGTIVDKDGKTVSIIGTDGTTYVKGDSDITVTVGSYSDSADFSNATTLESFDGIPTNN